MQSGQSREFAELDYLRGLAQRLDALEQGRRGALIEDAAQLLGCTGPTVYARLKKIGWTSGRKQRSDRGTSKVPADQVKTVAALMHATHRQNGKRLMTFKHGGSMALSNGLLDAPVSPQTLSRQMKRIGCHPEQMGRATPHASMKSLYPNHVWQLDASLCVLYYLRGGKVGVMDERKFNIRKPRDVVKVMKDRVLRYALTDHCSASVLARYYQTSGEDQKTLLEFLIHSFQQRGSDPMYGVPHMLVWDKGSANQSHGIENLLTQLQVRHWTHIAGNPRAKGQVEGVHNMIERGFESCLSFARIDSVEQLNAELDIWLRAVNGSEIVRRTGMTRWQKWLEIEGATQLRIAPPAPVLRTLVHSKPQKRTVKGNFHIQFTVKDFEPALYCVKHVEGLYVGDEVTVAVNPYRAPSIFVIGKNEDGSTRYWECDPAQIDKHGFLANAVPFGERYEAPADSHVDTARKDLNEVAFGERDALDAQAARAKGRIAFDGAVDPFKDLHERAVDVPAHIPRRGTEIYLANPFHVEERPLTLVDLALELRGRRGTGLLLAERERVIALYPETIPLDAFNALIEQLLRGELPALSDQAPAAATPPRLYAVR
jgi:transposase InsO family protein